jgi:hypothetical protein
MIQAIIVFAGYVFWRKYDDRMQGIQSDQSTVYATACIIGIVVYLLRMLG